MKKRYFAILTIPLVFLVIFLLNSKYGFLYKPNSNIGNASKKDTNNKLTWDEYQSLFEYIADNIAIENLKLKASTLGDNITAVDKELTFNKRQYLTLNGILDNSKLHPTDEQLVFEDTNQSKQFTISILYTDNYIGENLIGYPTNVGFDDLNETLVKKSTHAVLTYKNLVIVVHQISTDKYDLDLMYKTIKSLVDLLGNYK